MDYAELNSEDRSERKQKKGNNIRLRWLWGWTGGTDRRNETKKRERDEGRKRRNRRILIRTPKNKIIRLSDSKCQLGERRRRRE